MVHVLVHDYLGIDMALIWGTVQHDVPELKRAVMDMLDDH